MFALYNLERQKQIIEILEDRKSISVNELASMLYVSHPTVRRDLTDLEEQGKVHRTHGGVVLRHTSDAEIPLLFREGQNNTAKSIIARKAAPLIHNGDVIFLDGSSTVTYLIPYFEKLKDIVVITNSPHTSIRLGEKKIKNYCTGGLLLRHSLAYVGSEAERFIENVNANICFFSSSGYTEAGMITDSSEREVGVKKAMIRNAAKSYYLADSSKLGKKFAYNVCSVHNIAGMIDER